MQKRIVCTLQVDIYTAAVSTGVTTLSAADPSYSSSYLPILLPLSSFPLYSPSHLLPFSYTPPLPLLLLPSSSTSTPPPFLPFHFLPFPSPHSLPHPYPSYPHRLPQLLQSRLPRRRSDHSQLGRESDFGRVSDFGHESDFGRVSDFGRENVFFLVSSQLSAVVEHLSVNIRHDNQSLRHGLTTQSIQYITHTMLGVVRN